MPHDRMLLVRHGLKAVGITLAGVGFIGLLAFAIMALSSDEPSPYVSLAAWIILPAAFYVGVIFLGAGLLWERRRRYQLEPDGYPRYLRIDLNRPGVRGLFYATLLLFLLILVGTAVGAYQAYEFTESTTFCASTCHSVMEPERVTHRISPHAEIACSACHVGKTPAEYLEAKIFGVSELYLLLRNDYPRPIPTPIQVMKPVRENCTGCHWEQKYWGKMHRDYSHYITGNDNQRWTLRMNVKVGGMYRFGGEGEGIHWHMKISPKVFYIATDQRLQKIPWVKLVTEQGEETIYQSTEEPLSKSELDQYEIRQMTCVDCHNRPAHQFKAPILAIDDAMAKGWIDPELPDVKAKGVELLLNQGYSSQQEAVATIRDRLLVFYREEYPQVFQSQREKVEKAADTLGILYRQNFFPEMKADWRAYPDNIGHFLSDGCFRCHDGLHVNAQGEAISNDCSLCHDIVVQGPADEVEGSAAGLPFRHPVDFGMPIGEMGKCTQCHDGSLGQ